MSQCTGTENEWHVIWKVHRIYYACTCSSQLGSSELPDDSPHTQRVIKSQFSLLWYRDKQQHICTATLFGILLDHKQDTVKLLPQTHKHTNWFLVHTPHAWNRAHSQNTYTVHCVFAFWCTVCNWLPIAINRKQEGHWNLKKYMYGPMLWLLTVHFNHTH